MTSLTLQEKADLSDLFAKLEYARKPLSLRVFLAIKAFSKNCINKLSSNKRILEFLHIKTINSKKT
ncbi:MAG: hypothetical protein SPH02_00565 [Campylobacter sp.]|nr:hypothetical protein [Campylobacter sp.]